MFGGLFKRDRSYSVKLVGEGTCKVTTIKAVRSITGLCLKEAKALVDNIPSTVCESLPLELALAAKDMLHDAGAVVEVSKN